MTIEHLGSTGRGAASEETSLYRFFGAGDELLYIGITARGRGRWHQHNADKAWWSDVVRATVEHYPTRDAALTAERDAIIAEHPRHNVVHNGGACAEGRRQTPTKPAVTGAPNVLFELLRSGRQMGGRIWLEPEVCLEPCVDDCDGDGADRFRYWMRQALPKATQDGLRISWFVNTTCGAFEPAPHQPHLPWAFENWLDVYTLPKVVPDSFRGAASWADLEGMCEPIDWYRLPVRWDRFPELVAEIEWTPAPLQPYMPIHQIIRSRNGAS